MDALALLCNLHADGPDSLLQLRDAGCDRLELLAALEIDELASVLETSPAASRRFLSEARLLAERLTGSSLEEHIEGRMRAAGAVGTPDPVDALIRQRPDPAPRVSRDALDEVQDALDEGDPEVDLEFPRPRSAPRRTGEPLADAVLDAWRELDAELPPESSMTVDSDEAADAETPAGESEAVLVPQPPPSNAGRSNATPSRANPSNPGPSGVPPRATPLASAVLEGLTDEMRRQLIDAGLTTLEELLESDAMTLAQRSAVPFTRLARVQFVGRRQRPLPPTRSAPQAAPARSPAVSGEPTGGPFA